MDIVVPGIGCFEEAKASLTATAGPPSGLSRSKNTTVGHNDIGSSGDLRSLHSVANTASIATGHIDHSSQCLWTQTALWLAFGFVSAYATL